MYYIKNFMLKYADYTLLEPEQADKIRSILGVNYNKNTDLIRGEPRNVWFFIPFTYKYQLKNLYKFHLKQGTKLVFYFGSKNYLSINSGYGTSHSRLLPPSNTSQKMPQLSILHTTLFQRSQMKFIPNPENTNLLFFSFYQYFVLQFFNTDSKLEVTASQLYGSNDNTMKQLRSFTKGKLKTEHFNGEHYPPYLSSVKNVHMVYPSNKYDSNNYWFDRIVHSNDFKNQNPKWAMGHPLLSMNPLLFVMSTLWIREHNRVCNILFKKCPQWSDERLYDTSKLIVIGEMISIMSNEIMNAHTKYSLKLRYEPEILQTSVSIPLANGINSPDELLFATMWPSSLPDKLNLTSLSSLLFGNNRQLFVDGLSNIIQLMISQKMGMITSNNDGPATEPLTKVMLKLSREKKFQSFNNYRRHLGLVPYNNFYSLTKDKKLAIQLKNLYEDIENVELIPGMLVEKHKNGVVSSTNMAISNNLIMTAILSSPIGRESWWKQDTFGGDEGFEIVKTATIKKLICYNLIDQCKSFDVKLKSI